MNTIAKRSIHIPAGLYSIEGVPVFLPEVTAEVHTPNAAALQKLIAKCQDHGIKPSDRAVEERATEDDFRARTEGAFARVSQHLEAQHLAISSIGDMLAKLNARLDSLDQSSGKVEPPAPTPTKGGKKDSLAGGRVMEGSAAN